MKPHNKRIIKELCCYLGQDLDHPMCKELMKHVIECPECHHYIETIKMTVQLYRQQYENQPVPEDVKEKLLTRLNLKK